MRDTISNEVDSSCRTTAETDFQPPQTRVHVSTRFCKGQGVRSTGMTPGIHSEHTHLQALCPCPFLPSLSSHLCLHDYLCSAHTAPPQSFMLKAFVPSQPGSAIQYVCSHAHSGPLPQLASSFASTGPGLSDWGLVSGWGGQTSCGR